MTFSANNVNVQHYLRDSSAGLPRYLADDEFRQMQELERRGLTMGVKTDDDPEELKVDIEGDSLVKGEHKEKHGGQTIHRTFHRLVTLPDGIEGDSPVVKGVGDWPFGASSRGYGAVCPFATTPMSTSSGLSRSLAADEFRQMLQKPRDVTFSCNVNVLQKRFYIVGRTPDKVTTSSSEYLDRAIDAANNGLKNSFYYIRNNATIFLDGVHKSAQ